MRLKIKIGYLISFLIIVVGVLSYIGKYDKTSIILYTGLFLFSCAGVFYSLKDRKDKASSQDWLKLSGYFLIGIGVFIHFIFEIETKVFLLALGSILQSAAYRSNTPYSKTQ